MTFTLDTLCLQPFSSQGDIIKIRDTIRLIIEQNTDVFNLLYHFQCDGSSQSEETKWKLLASTCVSLCFGL